MKLVNYKLQIDKITIVIIQELQKSMSFNKLNFSPWVIKLCQKIKYNKPTQIQSLAIPSIMSGKSVIINSETGSGKTATFSLPTLDKLSRDPFSIYAVVIAPSLELALQIHQQLEIFGQSINLRLALLVGGVNYSKQTDQLENYPHIIVGTPGRICQMLEKNEKFKEEIKRVDVLIMDEADRLMESKQLPIMQAILKEMPDIKQILLATATIDENFEGKRLQKLLNTKIDFVKHSTFRGKKTVDTLIQNYIFTPEDLKPGYLLKILKDNPTYKIIVFVKTCKQCTLICQTLKSLEFKATQLHSFMKNNRRIANLAMFRGDVSNILVTTDLTSRGLDINNVNLVINYNMPRTVADYIHRVGRTARNGYEGEAISFLTPNEVEMFKEIQKEIGVKIEENQLSDKPDLDLVSTFNKKKREVKINLVSTGVMDELEQKRQRKVNAKKQFFKARDFQMKAQ